MSEGRRQASHAAHVCGDGRQTLGCQLQSVIERILLGHLGQVLTVGSQELCLTGQDGIGHRVENTVALLVGHESQTSAGLLHTLESFCQRHGMNAVWGVCSGFCMRSRRMSSRSPLAMTTRMPAACTRLAVVYFECMPPRPKALFSSLI